MDRARYDSVLRQYVTWAEAHPDVIGLAAVGSTAARSREPDAWSDHDILVVTRAGAAEALRADLSWVPNYSTVILEYAETAHGFVLVDSTAHLIELAIFEADELAGVVIEDCRVLVDTDGLTAVLMEQLHGQALAAVGNGAMSAQRALALFVKQLIVGINRYSRGEQLSAHDRIRGEGVRHLLALADAVGEPFPHSATCVVDPFRRFEVRRPDLARDVLNAVQLPLPQAAQALLDLAAVVISASPQLTGRTGLVAVRQLLAALDPGPGADR